MNMKTNGASGQRRPGRYFVAVADDGHETWELAVEELPPDFAGEDRSLDTVQSCGGWLGALWDTICGRHGAANARYVFDLFLMLMEWGPDQLAQREAYCLQTWFAVADKKGLTQDQAALELIERQKKGPRPRHACTVWSVDALKKELQRVKKIYPHDISAAGYYTHPDWGLPEQWFADVYIPENRWPHR